MPLLLVCNMVGNWIMEGRGQNASMLVKVRVFFSPNGGLEGSRSINVSFLCIIYCFIHTDVSLVILANRWN
jgi:hypothetical protein